MPEQLQKIVQPVKSRWDALAKDQKIKLVAAIAVVLVAIVLTLVLALRTRYDVFVTGLDSQRILNIQTALDAKGIKHKPGDNGTSLLVDRNSIVDAKLAIETDPSTASMDFTYEDAFANIGMGTTDTTLRANLKLAKQTEIQQILQRYTGVLSAQVMLETPENIRLFMPSNDQERSRAVANLVVDHELSESMGTAMARTMMRSVEGLEMENIEITDQEGRTVYSGLEQTLAETTRGSAAELQAQERLAVTKALRDGFMPQFFNDVQVIPNLVYDNTVVSRVEQEQYDLPSGADSPLPLSQSNESSSGENTSPADDPGVAANAQQQQTYQNTANNNSSFEVSKDATDYALNKTTTVQEQGPSSYDQAASSLTILLSRYTVHSQEQMQFDDPNFTDLAWRNYKNTTISTVVANDASIASVIDSASKATGIPPENISVTLWEVPIFEDIAQTPIDIPLIIALSLLGLLLLMLAYALIRRQKMAQEEEEAEPELSVEDLLVSTQLEEAKEEAEKLEEIDYAKESEIKKQIEKFVNEKPEAVAALLRNWLNTEDW